MKYIDVLVKEGYSPSYIMDVIEHKDISMLTQVIENLKIKRQDCIGKDYPNYTKAIKMLSLCVEELAVQNSVDNIKRTNLEY